MTQLQDSVLREPMYNLYATAVVKSVCMDMEPALLLLICGIVVAATACLMAVWTYDVSRAHFRYGCHVFYMHSMSGT